MGRLTQGNRNGARGRDGEQKDGGKEERGRRGERERETSDINSFECVHSEQN